MLTLLLAMDYFPYPGERQFLGFIRANYLSLFPKLLDQSHFNRRARRLEGLMEELRRSWVKQMGVHFERTLLLDTKPVPVVGYKRSKGQSDFTGSATYGYCASRQMKYFGYKLVVVSSLEGVPLVYSLVPAHSDEREAAESVLQFIQGCDILADKGFIGTDWQSEISRTTGNRVSTATAIPNSNSNIRYRRYLAFIQLKEISLISDVFRTSSSNLSLLESQQPANKLDQSLNRALR